MTLTADIPLLDDPLPAEPRPIEHEASFALLFDNHPLPMWVCDKDSLDFLAVNAAAARHYGYSVAEMLRMSLLDLCPPEEVAALLDYRAKVIDTVSGGMSLTIAWQHLKKDRTTIEVEATWSRIFYKERAAVLVLAHDVTERLRADRQIQEQASLLNLAHDAIIVADLGHRVLFWNKGAERLYGWHADDAIGRPRHELLGSDSNMLATATAALFAKGEWSGEMRHKTREGKAIIVSSRWTLVRDESDRPKSILVINTDITETKMLESQFLRTQRLESIGTLASGIAHDLNNILSPILMSVGILRMTVTDGPSEKMLKIIEGSAERGAEIVKQVLTFARGVDGERVTLQARHLVNEMVKVMAQTFPRNITIRNNLPKELPPVSGDATQLHQVLLNLCVNARDAMPEGGTITLEAEHTVVDEHYASMNPDAVPGSYVILSVSDSGSGIPPEVMNRIFDPFFTTKEQGKGTGLGLSTVVGIVKSHRGFMTVKSNVGEGTSFHIAIPVATDGGTGEPAARPTTLPTGNGEIILIVDDEPSIREAASRTLEANGYRVYAAEDGTDALALYFQRRSEIDLVLTDIQMDLMDGVGLTRALKRIEPDVKVIASSGHAAPEKRDALKQLGVCSFLDKPYTADRLLIALHDAIHAAPKQSDEPVFS